eukprot:2616145-Rhodomonas_salina.4
MEGWIDEGRKGGEDGRRGRGTEGGFCPSSPVLTRIRGKGRWRWREGDAETGRRERTGASERKGRMVSRRGEHHDDIDILPVQKLLRHHQLVYRNDLQREDVRRRGGPGDEEGEKRGRGSKRGRVHIEMISRWIET